MRADLRLFVGALALLLLPLAGALALAASHFPLPENPVGGNSVFVEKGCLGCHAIQGSGGTVGPDLGRVALRGGFLGVAGIMWNHAPKMIAALAKERRPLPRFTTDEMTQLVAFLYALNYLDRPGDARRGEEAFGAKRCRSCHSVGGEGGDVGPPLDRYARYVSPLFLTTALWNKGRRMAEAMERARVPRPSLSGEDVRDLVAFIRTNARRGPGEPSRVFARPGNPRAGAALFASKGCAGCHALRGREEGEGPRLDVGEFRASLSTIASRMWNHGPGMWARWRAKGIPPISFTVGEMADVTAYLYFLQFEPPPGDLARGAALFGSRGCADCHALGPGGQARGPDLRTKGPWESEIDLARDMWNHAAMMHARVLLTAHEWPQLSPRDVADLLAYVRSIGGTLKREGAGR